MAEEVRPARARALPQRNGSSHGDNQRASCPVMNAGGNMANIECVGEVMTTMKPTGRHNVIVGSAQASF